MALRNHPNADVQRILDKTGGKIVEQFLYVPPEEILSKGYERLRGMMHWMWGVRDGVPGPLHGKPVPQEITEVMLWLRDHYGPDEHRKAAMDRYLGLTNAQVIARFAADYQARCPAPSETSTSPAGSSSGMP